MKPNDYVIFNIDQNDDVPDAILSFNDACKWGGHNKGIVQAAMVQHSYDPQLRLRLNASRKLYPLSPQFRIRRPSQSSCTKLFRRRRSSREFDGSKVALKDLNAILSCALVRDRFEVYEGIDTYFGATPSAGGLFPIETYLAIRRVEGLAPGVYYVDAAGAAFFALHAAGIDGVEEAFRLPPAIRDGYSFALVHTSIANRFVGKYGARGYRFALLEAGHAAQNLLLAATLFGVGSMCWGGYWDDSLHQALGIDGEDESAVHCLIFGHEIKAHGR